MGGLAVTQALEGAGTAVMKDGKFIGVEASGKSRLQICEWLVGGTFG